MIEPGRDLDCEQREQAAAHVLGALERDEGERYREHLDGCAICGADVARLQPIVDLLPTCVPPAIAPQEVRDRIVATVRSEAEILHAAGSAADRPQRSRRRLRSPRLQLLGVAVAMGVGVLFGAVVLDTGSHTPQIPVTRVTSAQLTSEPPGASAVVRQQGGRAELVVSGLSQPPRGRIYEIWLAREGGVPQPTNALFDVTHSGGASVDVPGNLAGVKQVMVTAEPLGGSSHPTSTPIIVATLRSS